MLNCIDTNYKFKMFKISVIPSCWVLACKIEKYEQLNVKCNNVEVRNVEWIK